MEALFPDITSDVSEGFDKKLQTGKWVGIIIHHTGTTPEKADDSSAWARLYKSVTKYLGAKDENYVSAHFNIGRLGECAQIVDPRTHIAFHAGRSTYWHPEQRKFTDSWNNHAIGIEITGDGNKFLYSAEQYRRAAQLCARLMKKFPSINPLCIVGHEVIAPDRKVDPGKFFDWQTFYKLIYQELEKLD